ncbi:phosphohydrolase [Acidimicrobiales bacterium]|mgnify:FL=1|jgi:predicted HD phosphohydrolase|nr:phosphohydrolase [Acidimicrobiales bacterium]
MSLTADQDTSHDDLPRASFTSFEESTAEDWAKIIPQISVTQSLVADRVIGLMRELETDHGGFPVSRLEHSLQTATRAERDNRDDEYILCALIHDVGDTLAPFNHPAIAAAIVKPFVSEANHFMVKNHGEFQGYYFWDYIGMDGNAREQFRDSPHFDYTEEFCRLYDQTAFDATYKSNPLEHYEPLIRQLLKADG